MSEPTRECPSCALEAPRDADVCPYCGYEFPEQSSGLKWAAVVFALLMLWPLFELVQWLTG